jgi:hypothetical protein
MVLLSIIFMNGNRSSEGEWLGIQLNGWPWSEFHMLIFCLCLLLPPLAAVIWEVLRKLGLRPGYDWALSVLAVHVVLWQERTVPGLHQPGGLVEQAGGAGLGRGPRVLTFVDGEIVLNSLFPLSWSLELL